MAPRSPLKQDSGGMAYAPSYPHAPVEKIAPDVFMIRGSDAGVRVYRW